MPTLSPPWFSACSTLTDRRATPTRRYPLLLHTSSTPVDASESRFLDSRRNVNTFPGRPNHRSTHMSTREEFVHDARV